MKVLFVASGNSKFGISPIVFAQGESIKNCGVDLEYFLVSQPKLRGYLRKAKELRTFLRTNQIDILHAHYGLCGFVAQLAKGEEKTVVSFMGDDVFGSVDSTGRYTNFSKFICKINRVFAKHRYDHVIVKSNSQFKALSVYKKISVIPNGVDLLNLFPMCDSAAKTKIGWSVEKKNIMFAANPHRPEKNFKLIRKALLHLNNKVIELQVVNGVPHDQMKWYFNAADVLVFPSLHEGSPNVIKEAMACNCPIVSTDVGDVKEVIGNTEGCYITSYDPEDVAEKIKMALEFGKRTKGRDRIIAMGLDSDSTAKKIINLYKKVIRSIQSKDKRLYVWNLWNNKF